MHICTKCNKETTIYVKKLCNSCYQGTYWKKKKKKIKIRRKKYQCISIEERYGNIFIKNNELHILNNYTNKTYKIDVLISKLRYIVNNWEPYLAVKYNEELEDLEEKIKQFNIKNKKWVKKIITYEDH